MSIILISNDGVSIEVPTELAFKSNIIARKASETWSPPGIVKTIQLEITAGTIEYIMELIQTPLNLLPEKLQADGQTLCTLLDILKIANFYDFPELINNINKTITLYLNDPMYQAFEIKEIRKEIGRGYILYTEKKDKPNVEKIEELREMLKKMDPEGSATHEEDIASDIEEENGENDSSDGMEEFLNYMLESTKYVDENLENKKIEMVFKNFDSAKRYLHIIVKLSMMLMLSLLKKYRNDTLKAGTDMFEDLDSINEETDEDIEALEGEEKQKAKQFIKGLRVLRKILTSYDYYKTLPPNEFIRDLSNEGALISELNTDRETYTVSLIPILTVLQAIGQTDEEKDVVETLYGIMPIFYSDHIADVT